MITALKSSTGNEYKHDDSVSEDVIRRNLYNFFKTKHGKRETYTFYRGFIIVRNTRQYSNGERERVSVLYMYYPVQLDHDVEIGPDVLHIGVRSKNISTIKRQIDRILETGDMTV